MLNGVNVGSCPPYFLCLPRISYYAMQMDLHAALGVIIGGGLLISALKDLLTTAGPIEISERNIEAVALPPVVLPPVPVTLTLPMGPKMLWSFDVVTTT